MQTPDALQLHGERHEILLQIRDAAQRILDHHGQDTRHIEPFIRCAWFRGFKITSYRWEGGRLGRRDGRWWTLPSDRRGDPFQNVIDIDAGERVASLGWHADGPIRVDGFRRGIWEIELLKAAGLAVPLPADEIQSALVGPQTRNRWVANAQLDRTVENVKIFSPLTFSVIGYQQCISQIVEPGTDLAELRKLIEDAYGASRTADGQVYLRGAPVSCFTLEVRNGARLGQTGRPYGRTALRYLIGSHGGLDAAASLLMRYNYELRHSAWCEEYLPSHALRILEQEVLSVEAALALAETLPELPHVTIFHLGPKPSKAQMRKHPELYGSVAY
ncbi:hypothetical protein [Methylobacterium brachythecii]|uniref:Uncharacterized protein n=1 Tax=Methylobacterium brachythecii TaxID=1176177 RepID=A0A7W6F8B9_9HYPH|nr:hypothetical protein [Methylobacterium brachythecii]MBB3903981.1 hypothetical protein [Methylobacterium brachythecii]GLS42725.1 hypothetical protein GCM10007884_07100 [Methylobacterium brachythecii]